MMFRIRKFVFGAVGLLVFSGAVDVRAVEDASRLDYTKDIRPILERYCSSCHNTEKQKGDLDFSTFKDVFAIQKARRVWLTVVDQVRRGEMPPKKEAQPSEAEKARLADWSEWAVNSIDCKELRNPGRVTIHRLNRSEYQNTVRDLLGVTFDASVVFPSDGDGGTGFDTNADSLFIPPLLMEKYFQAADRIADEAIPSPPIALMIPAAKLLPAPESAAEGPRILEKDYEKKTAYAAVRLPTDGVYEIRVVAWSEDGKPAARFDLKLDDKTVRAFAPRIRKEGAAAPAPAIPGSSLLQGAALKRMLEQQQQRAGTQKTVKNVNPYELTFSRRMPEGVVKVGLEYLIRSGSESGRLFIESLEIVGPIRGAADSESATANEQIFVVKPSDSLQPEQAGRQVLGHVMQRAYRRPVSEAELNWAMGLYKKAEQRGDPFSECVKLAMKGILISPNFLFRVEHEEKGDAIYQLNDWELASRISYFLWSSMPDEELFALAAAGKLNEPVTLEKQIRRMLADPRSRQLSERFAGQWLGIEELGKSVRPDRSRFPQFTRTLRDAMVEETVLFFDSLVRENRSLVEVIQADYTFLNEELAAHYGVAGVKGQELRKVSLRDANRGGVVTMASALTVSSYPLRTSPPKRGTWILDRVLGTPPPPPLPDAGSIPGDDKQSDGLSLRKRLEQHRKDPRCASCHNRIDPMGFGLENFDAIGRYRTQGVAGAIDATGELPGGEKFNGPKEFKTILLARKQQVIRNLAEQMLVYALGRNLQYYDVCAVDKIVQAVEKDGYKSQRLIMEIAASLPFQYRVNDPDR